MASTTEEWRIIRKARVGELFHPAVGFEIALREKRGKIAEIQSDFTAGCIFSSPRGHFLSVGWVNF